MTSTTFNRTFLKRFAWLSIGAAIFTIVLKTVAYLLTGSVGLLSDALESIVNLVGAIMALAMLAIAARPADEDHTFGHSKAEYFSSGVEGTLILIAAASIAYTAINRLLNPQPLEKVWLGLIVSAVASLANLSVSMIISRAGKRYNSISLVANAHHLMTDVWTSAGVIGGVGLVAITGWQVLDPILALLVAANIVWTGTGIVRGSVAGLMDRALDEGDQQTIQTVLDSYSAEHIEFHLIRTRQSGSVKFLSMHVMVPGDWTVEKGHKLVTKIEKELSEKIQSLNIITHLESINDPESWDDVSLNK
jgi:cation diffusion facilitator family transporter